MKNIILLLTALLMSCHVMAQETIVTGTICQRWFSADRG